MIDDEMKKIFEQMKELPIHDRLTTLSLVWIGETLSLLMNTGDQKRITIFKQSIDRLFDEAAKAMTNMSANSN